MWISQEKAVVCYNDNMIVIEEIRKIRKDSIPLITVITGDDLGQYTHLKADFLQKIGFDKDDLAYSYFDMSEVAYSTAEMDLESLPFFADEKIVIFDQLLDVTTDKKSFLSEQELKRLEHYIENPADTTRLVIFAPGKLDGKRRVVKILKRQAKIFEARELKEAEFKTFFQKEVHQLGLVFDAGIFDELALKSNFDFSDMMKNIAFLKAYKTTGHITHEDIKEAIPKTLQDNIFDLTQFVLLGKIDQARELVRELRLQGEDEIKLIAVMLGQFRTYYQVRLLAAQGKSEPQMVSELADYLGRQVNPYQIKFALKDSRTLSLSLLKDAIKILIETDFAIKTGTYDKDYLFDIALLKISASMVD